MPTYPPRPVSPPPRITVDSHTHVLPLRLAAKIRSFFESSGMTSLPAPSSCCAPSDEETIRLCYPVAPPALLDALLEEQEGSSAIWTLPYAHQAGMSSLLNTSILELSRELTEAAGRRLRVVPGLTVHPGDGEGERGGSLKPEEVLDKAVREGAKVAKLHCSVGDYSVLDTRLSRFWMLAQALRLPVVVHAGTSVMGTTEADELVDIGVLCTRYPTLLLILAHAGHPATFAALELTRLHPNLYLDTTPVISSLVTLPPIPPPSYMSPPLDPSHATPVAPHEHLLHLALQGRILFGSDAPNTSRTRGESAMGVRYWVRECVSKSMGSVKMEDVGTEMERVAKRAEALVLGGAAKRLESGVCGVEEAREDLGWDMGGKL